MLLDYIRLSRVSLRIAAHVRFRDPPTISKHYATIISNLAVHIHLGLSRVSLS